MMMSWSGWQTSVLQAWYPVSSCSAMLQHWCLSLLPQSRIRCQPLMLPIQSDAAHARMLLRP